MQKIHKVPSHWYGKLDSPKQNFFCEILTEQIYSRIVNEGDMVVDVGANHGRHTLPLALLVGESGKVFAYEPNPELAEKLRSSFQTDNIVIKDCGLGQGSQTLTLSVPINNDGHGSFNKHLEQPSGQGYNEYRVKVETLDNSFSSFQSRVSFIKIDVEGFELEAIKGSEKVLREHRPILVIESWSQAINDYMTSVGYQCSNFFGGHPLDGNIHNFLAFPREAYIDFIGYNDLGRIFIDFIDAFEWQQ